MISIINTIWLYAHIIFIQPNYTEVKANVSCYTSDVAQTDDSPFTTADGTTLRSGSKVVANNALPFGTAVQIEGTTYYVHDRMNKRYDGSHYDIWFEDYTECINFGRQNLIIKIF